MKKRIKNSSIYEYLLCVLSGVILAVSFTVPKLFWLCFVGLVPFIYTIFKQEYGVKKYAKYVYCFSLGFYVPLMKWLFSVASFFPFDIDIAHIILFFGIILIGLIQGTYILIATMFFCKIKRNSFIDVFSFSALFILGEWLMEYTPIIPFPWVKIGVISAEFTPFIQSASLFGGMFVSLIIVIINACVAYLIINYKIRKRCVVALSVAVGIFALNLTYGYLRLHNTTQSQDDFSALVVQGNFSALDKWVASHEETLEMYEILSRQGANDDTKIIVWPETAITLNYMENSDFDLRIKALAKKLNSVIVVGIFTNQEGNLYNSLIAFLPDGSISKPYSKQFLAPFGEYLPFKDLIKKLIPSTVDFIEKQYPLFSGEDNVIMDSSSGKLGGMICYESIFSNIAVENARDGAQIIVLPSNDSWFGESSALHQHYSHALMRAVESDRFILRASNTGITSIISPNGEMLKYAQPFKSTFALNEVSLKETRTFYVISGPILVIPCIAVFLYSVYAYIITNFKKKGD